MPHHKRYGATVKYLSIKAMPLVSARAYVLFPRHNAGGSNELQPLDCFTGLEKLLAQCIFVPSGFQSEDVEHLLRWHARIRYFDITFNDCDAAVDLLNDVS